MYIHDEKRVQQIIDKFFEFVSKQPAQKGLKVSFKNGYLHKQEGYKDAVYIRASDILQTKTWNKKMVRSGEIAKLMVRAMQVKDNNFMDWRTRDNLIKKLEENQVQGSQVLYDLFLLDDDRGSLEKIVEFTGSRNYDIISTLFFLKAPDYYYPCRPRAFRNAFQLLDMETGFFKECNYDNYIQFNEAIRELALLFSNYAGAIDVLDAHSFAWIIGKYKIAQEYIFVEDEPTEPGTEADNTTPKKERLASVRVRINQSEFRKNQETYWQGRCAVTRCNQTDILIASHIKAWRDCETNYDSVNTYNGLLLTPNLDKLFDVGLISFDENGIIMISDKLAQDDRTLLGIKEDMKMSRIEPEHNKYLEYHRNKFFPHR